MGFFLRFFQMNMMLRRIDDHFQVSQKFKTEYELIKLVVLVLIMAHIFGCGFHYLAILQIESGMESWLGKFDLQGASIDERYISSIYFTFISMITVGYGDIYPTTTAERLYVLIMTVFTTGVFGYSVNKISSIFSTLNQIEQDFEKKKFALAKYLKSRNISHQLQVKLIKNLEYLEYS